MNSTIIFFLLNCVVNFVKEGGIFKIKQKFKFVIGVWGREKKLWGGR